MSERKQRNARFAGIQTRMLVIILPLIVVPMLILAAVGFLTASREAAKVGSRYLDQRETDLRTIAESPLIRDYFNNRYYGLIEEAETYRGELERALGRFAERSNRLDTTYATVRYVDDQGREVVKIEDGAPSDQLGTVAEAEFFESAAALETGRIWRSPIAPAMVYAMPVYEPGGDIFQGVVALDFVYPIDDFRRTTGVIALTFVVITAAGLGVAVLLTVIQVRRLTNPIRALSQAAHRIAAGERNVLVEVPAGDEIGRLATAFNDMASSLEANERALKRKIEETTALYEIGHEITAQVALEPTLDLIVERARELLRADISLLALRPDEADAFAVTAYSGRGAEAFSNRRFESGEALGGKVATTGAPVVVDDYAAEYPDSRFREVVGGLGLSAALAVPLKARQGLMGVLYVFSRTPGAFREEDLQLFNALATQATISIENAKLYQQAREHAAELERRVAERTRALQDANDMLEQASQHKSEFLANMSHELRTPMNSIIGFARLVMRRSKGVLDDKQYQNLQKILASADHLLALINDILDLSKIEAGKIELAPSEFALGPLIEECLRTVEPLVERDRIALAGEVDEDLPPVYADRDKLRQVLMNLLSNAVKFTDRGRVSVRARQVGPALELSVADTGIGIAADKLDLIFEEFRQADSGATRQYGGTGLGLSISRHLVELMGGEIAVDSTPGAGSTFTVRLPLDGAPRAAAAPQAKAAGAKPRTKAAGDRPLVLAIDDDPQAIELLQEDLTEAGYAVVGATSGDEGIDKARALKPYAITLDILMPKKDGWQVLHELKTDPATRDIPVVVLSIVDRHNLGYRLGAADYLLKPIDREAILRALDRVLGAGGRVLVVDDDPSLLDLVRQMLDGEPYRIDTAADGEAALAAVARARPDVILLDLIMPGLDGLAVIERLRDDAKTRDIPIIVLTAKDLTAAERAELREQVAAVIEKRGLERDALIAELRAALGAYRRSRMGAPA